MKLFKKESKIEKEEYFSFCVEGIYKHKNGELFDCKWNHLLK